MRVSSIEPSQSCHAICQIVRPFLGLLSSLFSLIESEISEEASRQVVPSSGEEDYVSCFSLHFSHALAAFCVLYNRTEHSQGCSIC